MEEWDFSHYTSSCANQKGCTNCDNDVQSWCESTDSECANVERREDGSSNGWFYCGDNTEEILLESTNKPITDSNESKWKEIFFPKE